MSKKKNIIKVAELFAGVGGFRIGLEKASSRFKTIYSNQWEPSTKKQDASELYVKAFGNQGHSNSDINDVKTNEIEDHDLLVGGFPCQDYSVATSLKNSKGLFGKKGVLWWQIFRILDEKGAQRPSYLFLENVDRLLGSPAIQRGRDMAVILSSLQSLDYAVEWRVINAADYGMPQRRRRIFIIAYKKGTQIFKELLKQKNQVDWLLEEGIIAKTFPAIPKTGSTIKQFELSSDFKKESDEFNKSAKKLSPFENSGLMIGTQVFTLKTIAEFDGPRVLLKDVLINEDDVPTEYYIDKNELERWTYLKGSKNEPRTNKAQGYTYKYTEGSMVFPDALEKPSRTIITGEGGRSPSRFKHVVEVAKGKYRRLTPIELERLNMFPDDHTAGVPDVKRAFLMGNALVTGVIERIGKELDKRIN